MEGTRRIVAIASLYLEDDVNIDLKWNKNVHAFPGCTYVPWPDEVKLSRRYLHDFSGIRVLCNFGQWHDQTKSPFDSRQLTFPMTNVDVRQSVQKSGTRSPRMVLTASEDVHGERYGVT
jgi:hypothetical protein